VIDLAAAIEIAASPATIAAVMFDPQRYAEWSAAVDRVEVHDAALQPGARVTHHGTVMGQPVRWTSAVVAVQFPHLLDLQIGDGPFSGRVRYSIQRTGHGPGDHSRVQVHNRGELTGLAALAPVTMVTGAMQSAIEADLGRLKTLIETPAA